MRYLATLIAKPSRTFIVEMNDDGSDWRERRVDAGLSDAEYLTLRLGEWHKRAPLHLLDADKWDLRPITRTWAELAEIEEGITTTVADRA